MKCPNCGNEMFLDHAEQVGKKTELYHVCMNKRCSKYRRAYKSEGEEMESKIKPKQPSL